MEYIDTDGTVKQISESVERKFKEENQQWFVFEFLSAAVSLYAIYYWTVTFYTSLPR